MTLQLLVSSTWVRVVHELCCRRRLHILVEERVFPAWYGLQGVYSTSTTSGLFSFWAIGSLGRLPFTRCKLMKRYSSSVFRIDWQLSNLDAQRFLPLLLLYIFVLSVKRRPFLLKVLQVGVSICQGTNFSSSLGIDSGSTSLPCIL
jgi:hypothetical protein